MSDFMHRALLAVTMTACVSACVPTTTTSTTSTEPASVPVTDVYLATADNGFAVPAVPAEKVPDEFERQVVDYPSTEAPGTVVINPASKHLYFITGKNKAIRYGIAVGAAGFQWSGEALVTNRRPWPTWTPPKEMIERKPELSKWEKGQPGGPTNPLGARALYLTTNGVDYGYRIHGTPDWWSIGKNASSGCIRMINQDVMDLYARVPDGAKVIVLTADGRLPKGLSLPPPAPVKKEPAQPAPAVAQADDAAAQPVPAAVTAPVSGPMPEAPVPALDPAVPSALSPAPSAGPTPTGTPPAVDPVAPAAPAAPAAVSAPVLTAPPSVTPAPAPAATPAAPACAVPLVNGVCPKA
ncbi:MAG: L,D-transpeptidase [Rhodobacteraceae bacterium]|nr:L,D-transpeptidase [Paracoccaceae bacterium]